MGVLASPGIESRLTDDEASAALTYSFPNAGSEWVNPAGYVSHDWLYRRVYVEGRTGQPDPVRYTEQVLKSGWPFTVSRGFVRTSNGETTTEGVAWMASTPVDGPVRLLPVQPVWPGLVFYGLLGTVLVSGFQALRRTRPSAPTHPSTR